VHRTTPSSQRCLLPPPSPSPCSSYYLFDIHHHFDSYFNISSSSFTRRKINMTTTAKNFDISQLPSLKGKNAMTVEQEAMTRRKTCRFIEEAGRQLKFQRLAISTAEVFFHRFYAKHSFHDHDRFEVAVAAILLAGKTEETPRKLNTGTSCLVFQNVLLCNTTTFIEKPFTRHV